MKHFDNETYTLYSQTFNKKDKAKDDSKLDKQFKNALTQLIGECIRFTKIITNEKDKNMDFGAYLHF